MLAGTNKYCNEEETEKEQLTIGGGLLGSNPGGGRPDGCRIPCDGIPGGLPIPGGPWERFVTGGGTPGGGGAGGNPDNPLGGGTERFSWKVGFKLFSRCKVILTSGGTPEGFGAAFPKVVKLG